MSEARKAIWTELARRRQEWRGPIPPKGDPEHARYLRWANREGEYAAESANGDNAGKSANGDKGA